VNAGTVQNNANVVKFDGNEADRVGRVKRDPGARRRRRRSPRATASQSPSTAHRRTGIGEDDELWIEIPEKHAKILEQELASDIPATNSRR